MCYDHSSLLERSQIHLKMVITSAGCMELSCKMEQEMIFEIQYLGYTTLL